MQPENIKVNAKAIEQTFAPKKELTPVQQWDQLAFQIIYKELAPQGFKKITSGAFKGQQIAVCASPGLSKIKVTSVQRISAQLVRGFREKAKEQVAMQLGAVEIILDKTPFWHFIDRIELKERIKVLQETKDRLNSTPIQ